MIYVIYLKMTDEFDFFSTDCNNWNDNPFINTPNADPRAREREGGREGESIRKREGECVCK